MTTEQIKVKLESFVKDYQNKMKTFNSFLVIFYFVSFIKENLSSYEFINKQFNYVENEFEKLKILSEEEIDSEISKRIVLDTNKLDEWPIKESVFNKEELEAIKQFKTKTPNNPITLQFPICLSHLYIIYKAIEKSQLNNSQEILDAIKDLHQYQIPYEIKDDTKKQSLSLEMANYYLYSMSLVSLHILNEIEVEDFSKGIAPEASIRFNSETSTLFLHGEPIQIAKQKRLCTEHFILQCIFSKEDIFEPADFSEITRDFMREEYDKETAVNKFRHACNSLNYKIFENTKDKINDFILYSTEKLGWCKINEKYR